MMSGINSKGLTMLNIENIIPYIPSINMSVTSGFFINLFEFKINTRSEYFVELKNIPLGY